jgi:hypothetical protein
MHPNPPVVPCPYFINGNLNISKAAHHFENSLLHNDLPLGQNIVSCTNAKRGKFSEKKKRKLREQKFD